MGRKSKLTPELQTEIIKYIEAGCTDRAACGASNINYATFYRWIAKGELAKSGKYNDFCNTLKEARDKAHAKITMAMIKQIVKGNATLTMFWLQNRFPNDWKDRRVQHEISGKIDHEHTYENRSEKELREALTDLVGEAEAIINSNGDREGKERIKGKE